ncbi:hypothetical protein [Methylobacterium sp. JK268]
MDHPTDGRCGAAPPARAGAWDRALNWLRVLWVCRASATSAAAGLGLFWLVDQARDLFMEEDPYPAYWSGFFVLVLFWALIVHYAGRKVLEQQAWAASRGALPLTPEARAARVERYGVAAAWIPRLLGLVCLAAVGIGITRATHDLGDARVSLGIVDPTRLLALLAAAGLAYAAVIVLRRRLVDPASRILSWPSYLRAFWTGQGGSLLVEPKPFWFADLATETGRRARRIRGTVRADLVGVALMLSLAAVWVAALVWPSLLEHLAPRADFLIVVLALPVTLLAFLSALSHAWRVPVIALAITVLSVATGLVTRFHDLRTMPPGAAARLDLAEAIDRWVRLNCDLPPGAEATPCGARPVILASAGGASRAAYFTASIVGDILTLKEVDLGRRLFAISGVSGGSVGAAVIRAALDDAGPDGTPPCRADATSWLGQALAPTEGWTWRSCLQALTAGDFLSRPVIGLAFRDLFGFPFHYAEMKDRAILLEWAFEDHYRRLVGSDGTTESGLGRALGAFPHGPARWAPLLVLNTTSVIDGRRSIATDLLPFRCSGDTPVPLFPAAVDLIETLGAARACRGGTAVPDPGAPRLSLSTAATASARFPLISPPATIRRSERDPKDKLRGKAVDFVVDGGYFENDGITTALQLAEAMAAVKPGLPAPVILHVTNNPRSETVGDPDVAQRGKQRQAWYDATVAPVKTLVNTRDGHAAEAILAARRRQIVVAGIARKVVAKVLTFQVSERVPSDYKAGACTLAHRPGPPETKDAGPIKAVSMSWWLSGAVRTYLDSQICESRNVEQYAKLLRLVGTK